MVLIPTWGLVMEQLIATTQSAPGEPWNKGKLVGQKALRADPAPVYDACTMTPWLTLEQALGAPGLRVAPVRGGLPSPWSEFVRACFHVKRIPYSLVDARAADRGLTSIKTLTGQ